MTDETAPQETAPVTVLVPSLARPVGLGLAAAVLLFLSNWTFQMVGPHGWLLVMPLVVPALWLGVGAVHGLRDRLTMHLEIDQNSVVLGHSAAPRKEIVTAAYHQDLQFAGVRLKLLDDRWLGIPDHLHSPKRVMAALKDHGYPVRE